MSVQAKRRSNLFTSLRQRTSFKDLHSQLKPSRSSISLDKPLPLKPVDLNSSVYNKKGRIIKPVSAVVDEDATKPTVAKTSPESTLNGLSQNSDETLLSPENSETNEVVNKRLSVVFKTKTSPSSEKTLTTLASQSDLGSLDTLFMDNQSNMNEANHLEEKIKHFNYTDYTDVDYDKPSIPSQLRRTSNYDNISQFVTKSGILPISNRASLELEAKEIADNKSRIAKTTDEDFSVCLVENTFTMSFFHSAFDNDLKLRPWDDLDYNDILKSDCDGFTDPLIL